MMYKTIILHLLEQRPELYDQFRSQRMLLPALERYASELKTRHEAWKDLLSKAKPASDMSQIASEAMEIALKEFQDSLPPESPPNDEALSLDEAMAFLHRHIPPG